MDKFQCELQGDFAADETPSRQRVQRIGRERDNRALAVFRRRLQNSVAMMKDLEIDVMSTIGLETPKSDTEIEMHEAVPNPERQATAMRDCPSLYRRRERCTTAPTRQEMRYQDHH